jgi:anaerobic selenocysteine-containing dehydrogenase
VADVLDMTAETRTSFCRICEAHCGILVEVEHNRVIRISGDPDNPASEGYLCPKGAAFPDRFHHSPDRVLTPLKRVGGPGEFEAVSWDEALTDIAARLTAIRRSRGPNTIAMYLGNPASFSMSHGMWAKGFLDAVGSAQFHTAAPQDTLPRQVASRELYGSPTLFPFPDVARTDFCVILGANPFVTHGSLVTNPRFPKELRAIVQRGGRVVVVDPARTKTAAAFEHLAPRPDTDAWLVAAMIHEAFRLNLVDRAAVGAKATGIEALEAATSSFTPDLAARVCGIPVELIRELASGFATARRAVAYSRVGLCRGQNSTVATYLVDCLNIVTGNFDVEGGWVFGEPPVAYDRIAAKMGFEESGTARTPADGMTDIGGLLPWTLPDDLTTTGDKRVRALITTAGNPVASAPDGDHLVEGIAGLDLMVSLDLVVNDTTQYAHYILPTTTFLERPDMPLIWAAGMARSVMQYTEAVVQPPVGVREEWTILQDIARRMKLGGAYSIRASRLLARAGIRPSPSFVIDVLLRLGEQGDLFGLRRRGPRLSIKKLRRHPHGILLNDELRVGRSREVIHHTNGLADIGVPLILGAITEMVEPPADELTLIGRRSLRSINSWLLSDPEPMLFINPTDALRLELADGDRADVATATGSIVVPVRVDDTVRAGVVSYPHGWGGRFAPGANVNLLASCHPDQKERLSGASHLDGIVVQVTRTPERGPPSSG